MGNWQEFDAGHFIAASSCGFSLLFEEENVNGECKYDNGFNENHQLLYAAGLDRRFGDGTALSLKKRYEDVHFRGRTTKEWGKQEYEQKIIDYKEKVAQLDSHGKLETNKRVPVVRSKRSRTNSQEREGSKNTTTQEEGELLLH